MRKPTTKQNQAEISARAKLIDREKAEQRDLTMLLGFDPERGGRRYRELVVQKALGYPKNVVLSISDALVTVEQARLIQRALMNPQWADDTLADAEELEHDLTKLPHD